MRELGSRGGVATVERHGREHMRRIGRQGARTTIQRYGERFLAEIGRRHRLENPTNLEQAVATALQDLGFVEGQDYEREGYICPDSHCHHYTGDFVFRTTKTVVYADGERWHQNSEEIGPRADRETGQFPAVEVSPGAAVVDLNRLPDGKVMTGVLGGKTALLLTLFFRHLLGKEVPEIDERPSVIIQPHDTSPEQLQVTTQAQAAQALAAASRGMTPTQATQAAQGLLMRPVQRDLPPLLVEENAPHDVQLLLEEGKRQWDQRQSDAAVEDEDLQGG